MTDRLSRERYRPRLFFALRRAAGDYYDRLGLTAAGSAILALALLGAAAAGAAFGRALAGPAGPLVAGIAVWYAGAFGWTINLLIAHRIAGYEEPGVDAVRDAFREYGAGVMKLATFDFVITAVMALDAAFFLLQKSRVMQVAGVITAYILLLWLLAMLWHGPFLIRENRRTAVILKKSALLTLDNPVFTAGAFFVTITAGLILAATGIGAVLALGGFVSCLAVRLHRELLKKYEIVEDEPEVIEDGGWPSSAGPPRRLTPRER